MGLGKTVVALALILKHPPSPEHQQRQQQQDDAGGDSSAAWPARGGTLIAATPALMGQWESEVHPGCRGLLSGFGVCMRLFLMQM